MREIKKAMFLFLFVLLWARVETLLSFLLFCFSFVACVDYHYLKEMQPDPHLQVHLKFILF